MTHQPPTKSHAPWIWIRTRDGSPTLWDEDLAESFRSTRGAFTESLEVFVIPAFLERPAVTAPLNVLEFGLGAGTNWLFAQLLARGLNAPLEYLAVERNAKAFTMACDRWVADLPQAAIFMRDRLAMREIQLKDFKIEMNFQNFALPTILPGLPMGQAQAKADVLFFDPFGFDVNPDAYSPEVLKALKPCLKPNARILSYACNKQFVRSLESVFPGIQISMLDTSKSGLKRERLVAQLT